MLRKFLAIGFCVGFAVGLSRCGPTQSLPGPTSLLIRVSASVGFTTPIFAYVFSGTRNDFEAFASTQRPDPIPTSALSGPQTLRVIFPDGYKDSVLKLTVYALSQQSEVVGFGETEATLRLATDVEVEVGVQQLLTGTDAGGFDAGPVVACVCDGGCCGADGGCQPSIPLPSGNYNLRLAPCGTPGFTCTRLCDFTRANTCVNNTCRCGNGPACSPGEYCAFDGVTSRCVCDGNTGCQGCCSGGTTCRTGQQDDLCGRAGNPCASCRDAGVLATDKSCRAQPLFSQYGVCGSVAACPDTTTCATGPSCVKYSFPQCREPGIPNACRTCDGVRSTRCSSSFSSGCGCGDVEQCAPSHICLKPTDGGKPSCELAFF